MSGAPWNHSLVRALSTFQSSINPRRLIFIFRLQERGCLACIASVSIGFCAFSLFDDIEIWKCLLHKLMAAYQRGWLTRGAGCGGLISEHKFWTKLVFSFSKIVLHNVLKLETALMNCVSLLTWYNDTFVNEGQVFQWTNWLIGMRECFFCVWWHGKESLVEKGRL